MSFPGEVDAVCCSVCQLPMRHREAPPASAPGTVRAYSMGIHATRNGRPNVPICEGCARIRSALRAVGLPDPDSLPVAEVRPLHERKKR